MPGLPATRWPATLSDMDRQAPAADAGSYACPCLNIRIDIETVARPSAAAAENTIGATTSAASGSSSQGTRADTRRASDKLDSSRFVAPGRAVSISIAQLPLTSRTTLPAAPEQPQPLTTVTCLGCGCVAYGTDKPTKSAAATLRVTSGALRPHAEHQRIKTVGFTGEGQVEPPQEGFRDSAAMAADAALRQLDMVRPEQNSGALWLLAGCIVGAPVIASLQSSADFSQTFKVLIRDRDASLAVEKERASRNSTSRSLSGFTPVSARRLLSPDRQLHNSVLASMSGSSPSPARRRRHTRSLHVEEEEGDDLDTLHLLDTILPRLPASIVQEAAPTNGGEPLHGRAVSIARSRSPSRTTSYQKPFDAHLDDVALARLREFKERAQREIHDLLRRRTAEFADLEQELESEARSLRDQALRGSAAQEPALLAPDRTNAAVSPLRPNEGQQATSSEGSSPLFPRRKPSMPTATASAELTSQSENTTLRDTTGSAQRIGSGGGGVSAASGNTSIVGSYLSASFAMRGRDLPKLTEQKELSKEDEEEWFAAKRRLRERYPHGDHSALPSAVNSDDEGAVEVKKDVSTSYDDERERRGRGRGRNSGSREERSSDGRHSRTRSGSTDRSRGRSNGNTAGEDLSRSATAKKGALKSGSLVGDKSKAPAPPSEKKVAFASVTQEVEPKKIVKEESKDDERLTNEGETLFEIDEDMEGDDVTPTSSDINIDARQAAIEEGEEQFLRSTHREEAQGTRLGGDRAVENVSQSLLHVGSLSAMIASESQQQSRAHKLEDEEAAPNFDPASLRFDGREVYSQSSARLKDAQSSTTPLEDALRESGDIQAQFLHSDSVTAKEVAPMSAQEAMLTGFPDETRSRSVIGFRVSVGDAEAHASGLLAPNAPSHRNLWSRQRRNKYKMLQDQTQDDTIEEDDEEEDINSSKPYSSGNVEDGDESDKQHSAWQKRLADRFINSGIARKEQSKDDEMIARSVPIHVSPGPLRRSVSSTIYRDDTSGFDLEPKTSLPYQEKLLTPSLLKATRRDTQRSSGQRILVQHRPSLGTISDTSENSASTASVVRSVVPPALIDAGRGRRSSSVTSASDFKYSVPPSVPSSVQRGFDSPIVAGETAGAAASSHGTGSMHVPGLPPPTRTPYTPPPPPTSFSLRLTPNEKHRPKSLPLAEKTEEDPKADETGELDKVLTFMHTLEKLKLNKRTGWYHHRITQPESIADHMYRMGVLSMLLPNGSLDIGKCVQLCLVHDIAEALVGDLTPLDDVPKEEKHKREHEALLHLVHDLLGGSVAALRLEALWEEYEARATPESRAVKDLDRFELALQAIEYERAWNTTDLQPFYDGSTGNITHPRIQLWVRQLARERETLWSKTPYKYTQQWPSA